MWRCHKLEVALIQFIISKLLRNLLIYLDGAKLNGWAHLHWIKLWTLPVALVSERMEEPAKI